MNKKIDIIKNANILFIVNIIVLISMVFFRTLYIKQGYNALFVNIVFVINILFLVAGIIFNVLFLKDSKKYDNKKCTNVIIMSFIIYLLLNTVLMFLVNIPISKGYRKINEKLSSYCDTYGCDNYETVNDKQNRKFIIKKMYFDYDNRENELTITTTYNTKEVIKVEAVIYSRNDMYSEMLIKDVLKDYFYNFDYEIDEVMIKQAFDNRFSSSVKKDNVSYKVTEVYNDDTLEKLKTNIVLDLKQE